MPTAAWHVQGKRVQGGYFPTQEAAAEAAWQLYARLQGLPAGMPAPSLRRLCDDVDDGMAQQSDDAPAERAKPAAIDPVKHAGLPEEEASPAQPKAR